MASGGSWFTVILEQILAVEQQADNRAKVIENKLDALLMLAQQNQQMLETLTVLVKANELGIQQIIADLTPPVPTQFKAKVSTP